MGNFRYGSCFAGIGGFDLGLDRAGMECGWQIEKNEYCQRVLRKHWPDVPQWDDVQTFPPADWPAKNFQVDLLAAGFPCQDVSTMPAGTHKGVKGERSGLFKTLFRIAHAVGARWLLLENVPALTFSGRGLSDILDELARRRYSAQWRVLRGGEFGVRQQRDRLYIVAWRDWEPVFDLWEDFDKCAQCGEQYCPRCEQHAGECPCSTDIQYECEGWEVGDNPEGNVAHPNWRLDEVAHERAILHSGRAPAPFERGQPYPDGGRVVGGVSDRVDIGNRISACANAVIPAVAEFIGRAILKAEGQRVCDTLE